MHNCETRASESFANTVSPTELEFTNEVSEGEIFIQGVRYSTELTELHLEYRDLVNDDIVPLRHMTNLTMLYIPGNQISDLTPLSSLTNLRRLYIWGNHISDLSPLTSLVELELLGLENNQISDLSPLASLVELESLGLGNNQISDLSPLSGLSNLIDLSISFNQIIDISPLANLSNLEELTLGYNQIIDLSPLANLLHLQWLDLDGNQVDDWSPVSHVPLVYGRPDNTQTITVDVIALEGGTVEGGGEFSIGDTIVLTATPNEGYVFENWEDGNSILSNNQVYEFIATVDSDASVRQFKAVFSIMEEDANPLSAMYRAYYDVLMTAIDEYVSEFGDNNNGLGGLNSVGLVDFDNNGIPELVFTSWWGMGNSWFIYGYTDSIHLLFNAYVGGGDYTDIGLYIGQNGKSYLLYTELLSWDDETGLIISEKYFTVENGIWITALTLTSTSEWESQWWNLAPFAWSVNGLEVSEMEYNDAPYAYLGITGYHWYHDVYERSWSDPSLIHAAIDDIYLQT